MADNDDDLVDYDEEEVRLFITGGGHSLLRMHACMHGSAETQVEMIGSDWIGSFQDW
jgi:hypothetical protein